MNMLKPKPNPQQQLRDWQRRLRQECRNIERQIRGNFLIWVNFILCFYLVFMDFGFLGGCLIVEIVFSNLMGLVSDIQREEKSVQKAIRDAAKRNDMGSAKVYTSNKPCIPFPFWIFNFCFLWVYEICCWKNKKLICSW